MRKRLVLTVSVASFVLAVASAPFAEEVKDPSYAVKVDVPATKAGQHAVVKLHVKPGAGYHMNRDFPVGVTVAPTAGVTTDKAHLGKADAARFEDAGADFDVGLVAAAPGKQVVTADLKFAVCSATACEPKREKVSFTLEVK